MDSALLVKYRWVLAILLLIALAVFGISLYEREPIEDEAVIAGHSYHLVNHGHVKSDLYGGYLEGEYAWEIRQYAYHKLFVVTGALAIKLLGFNVYALKSVSLICLIIFLVAFQRYLKRFHEPYTHAFYLLATSLIVFNYFIFWHSFTFRPEIMVMMFGFLSFYQLQLGMKDRRTGLILIAGVFSGLSAVAHLNGLIYSFAGFMLLLFHKSFKQAFLFGIAAGGSTLLYFFDLRSLADVQALLYQLKTDPNVAHNPEFFTGIIREHLRLFHGTKEIIFSSLFLFCLVVKFRTLVESKKEVLIYLLFLILGLGMLSHGKTSKYALNYLPYMVIIISSAIETSRHTKKAWLAIGMVLLGGYLSIHLYYNLKTIPRHIDIGESSAAVTSLLPERHVHISAPSVYVFNEIGHYIIRGQIAWEHHNMIFHPLDPLTLESYLSFAKENGDKYVILDKRMSPNPVLRPVFESDISVGTTLAGFRLLHRTPEQLIFGLAE